MTKRLKRILQPRPNKATLLSAADETNRDALEIVSLCCLCCLDNPVMSARPQDVWRCLNTSVPIPSQPSSSQPPFHWAYGNTDLGPDSLHSDWMSAVDAAGDDLTNRGIDFQLEAWAHTSCMISRQRRYERHLRPARGVASADPGVICETQSQQDPLGFTSATQPSPNDAPRTRGQLQLSFLLAEERRKLAVVAASRDRHKAAFVLQQGKHEPPWRPNSPLAGS